MPLLVATAVLSLVLGVIFVLPIGGADVPVLISLLNSFTGLAVAASGFTLNNNLLIIAGTLVGASGILLTRMMSKAMGRSLANVLFSAFGSVVTAAGGADGSGETRPVKAGTPEDIGVLLAYARKVVIIPGYGLAVAQAQHTARELADLLMERGVEVFYAIHPVAGRMPGHMNVLLAEANVPYDELKEMDEANPEMATADVALVVGANDTVNPAAKNTAGSPIYGMPIINADEAAEHRVPQALDAARLRRHRQRPAVRREDHAAVRGRQGHAGQAGGGGEERVAGRLRVVATGRQLFATVRRPGQDALVSSSSATPLAAASLANTITPWLVGRVESTVTATVP